MAVENRLRFLSWNIDMDTQPITARTQALVRHIRFYNPDVLLLQEVTEASLEVIRSELCTTKISSDSDDDEKKPHKEKKENNESQETPADLSSIHPPSYPSKYLYNLYLDHAHSVTAPYFCALLTKQTLLTNVEHITNPFVSNMGRGYILIRGKLQNGVLVSFFTSHLESLKQCSDTRKAQLQNMIKMMQEEVDDGRITLFAGDTNLREAEVPARQICKTGDAMRKMLDAKGKGKKKTPSKFLDAWISAGEKQDDKYTWDMRKNTNLDFEGQDFKPFSRYDRAFYQSAEDMHAKVDKFKLVGKEPFMTGKFLSDHWGMLFEMYIETGGEKSENENADRKEKVVKMKMNIKKPNNGEKRKKSDSKVEDNGSSKTRTKRKKVESQV